jgi:hypothetical protein
MPSDYNLIPEHPTTADMREFISEQVGDIFVRLAQDRLLLHDGMSPEMDQRYSDAITQLSRSFVEWLEANDVVKISIWGMEP